MNQDREGSGGGQKGDSGTNTSTTNGKSGRAQSGDNAIDREALRGAQARDYEVD